MVCALMGWVGFGLGCGAVVQCSAVRCGAVRVCQDKTRQDRTDGWLASLQEHGAWSMEHGAWSMEHGGGSSSNSSACGGGNDGGNGGGNVAGAAGAATGCVRKSSRFCDWETGRTGTWVPARGRYATYDRVEHVAPAGAPRSLMVTGTQ
ncbi:hypothetical protein LZ30DRAFT_474674 [Colletotrichum cereale]|nr:hypothetical protein LZ30DRAFT_474674 [Colletotrichum cereale]